MCELLDKKGKRKKKEKKKKKRKIIIDHMIGQKKREICAWCRKAG